MHAFRLILPVALTALLLSPTVHAADKPDASNKNIAIVNGKPISQARFDVVARSQLQQGQDDSPEFREELREVLITREVLYQEALRQKLDQDPNYQAQLDVVKQQLLLGVLFEDFMAKHTPSEADLRKEYDRVKAESIASGKKEYRSRHILVKEEAEALAIIEQIGKGADFGELAKEKSLDPGSREDGGDLDWHEAERFVEPFAHALKSLKKGELTRQPIQTSFGYHIVQLLDERPVPFPEFDTVKEQIQQSLIGTARDKFVDGLRAKAKIEKTGSLN
jgi:peptidyl-prolyl cis-trans isomerase C